MAEERQGFLGRWARRKTDALQGRALEEPAAPVKPGPVGGLAAAQLPADAAPADAPAPGPEAAAPEKVLSLDDVRQLTQDSDFTPFMARNVGPEVRNAAMKKLFADPHYNVMDGLDIYIDDYSKSDPIPEAMLRQMMGSKLLKIFDDDKEDGADQESAAMQGEAASVPADNPNSPTPETVAQSDDSPDTNSPKPLGPEHSSQNDHAHSHLRLQPDHASPAPDAGHGTS
ncbi:MAG: DUF3306 domain-containing protein [Polaromonas sp.]